MHTALLCVRLQFKYKKIQSSANGKIKEGVIFSTYSSLISETSKQCKYKSRMKQLLKWCGPDFEGAVRSFCFGFPHSLLVYALYFFIIILVCMINFA